MKCWNNNWNEQITGVVQQPFVRNHMECAESKIVHPNHLMRCTCLFSQTALTRAACTRPITPSLSNILHYTRETSQRNQSYKWITRLRLGAVARALAFHQWGLGSILNSTLAKVWICWFSALLRERLFLSDTVVLPSQQNQYLIRFDLTLILLCFRLILWSRQLLQGRYSANSRKFK